MNFTFTLCKSETLCLNLHRHLRLQARITTSRTHSRKHYPRDAIIRIFLSLFMSIVVLYICIDCYFYYCLSLKTKMRCKLQRISTIAYHYHYSRPVTLMCVCYKSSIVWKYYFRFTLFGVVFGIYKLSYIYKPVQAHGHPELLLPILPPGFGNIGLGSSITTGGSGSSITTGGSGSGAGSIGGKGSSIPPKIGS